MKIKLVINNEREEINLIKRILIACTSILLISFTGAYFASEPLSSKNIFTTVKGPYGSCNTCHPNGGSAGRWDSEAKEISDDGDKVIPSLKGIGKKKTPEQIERAIKLVSTKYKVPVNDEQIKALVDYVSRL